MAYKALIRSVQDNTTALSVHVIFVSTISNQSIDVMDAQLVYGTDIISFTLAEIIAATKAQILDYSTSQSYGITANDIVWDMINTLTPDELTALKSGSNGIEGISVRNYTFPIFKSTTIASGVAVFHLTDTGLSGGNALFPNGVIQDSVNAFVSDATASYQMSYVFSNSNKTVTVTANKLTTSNILTGILGQAAANGAVVKLSVFGY